MQYYDIDTICLFYNEQLHSFIGANVIVELTKRVLEDVSELVKELYKEDMPEKVCAYFDNGSECKNYGIMSYFSLLVEMGIFTIIDLNYLIAGYHYQRLFCSFVEI